MFRYLISILEKKEKREVVKLAFLKLVSPIFDLFGFSVIIYILNLAIANDSASPELVFFSAGMGVISVVKAAFDVYQCYTQNRFTNFGAQRISMLIYELFQKEELSEHNKKTPMQALAIIREDTVNCMTAITGFLSAWINSATLLAFFLVLVYVSGLMGVIICLGLLCFMAVMYLQNRLRMMNFGKKRREYAIKSNAQVTTAFGVFKEVKIESRKDILMERYKEASLAYAKVQTQFTYKTRMIMVLMQNSVMTILFFFLAVVLEVGIHLAELLAPFVISMTLIIRMLPMAVQIVNDLVNVDFARKSYEAVRESLERYQVMKEREEKWKNRRKKQITLQKGIEIRNLTFGYQEDKKIFEDASVDIPAGKSIAVIGQSGAGKTTFLDLVLGLLKPETGSIRYDDYDIVSGRDMEGEYQADVGGIVSYIPQTVYLNGETIRNNVAFFEKQDQVDEERVRACLQHAQIWDDVRQMPQGMDTLIGENGLTISGGQRQRIALARALYKDFEILIMDEATAALDMETEKAVMDSIRQVKGNKTLLMVTHHMSLANECELLYKIENRKIIRIR